jgi:hypothetical protein
MKYLKNIDVVFTDLEHEARGNGARKKPGAPVTGLWMLFE